MCETVEVGGGRGSKFIRTGCTAVKFARLYTRNVRGNAPMRGLARQYLLAERGIEAFPIIIIYSENYTELILTASLVVR